LTERLTATPGHAAKQRTLNALPDASAAPPANSSSITSITLNADPRQARF
jgi:hypothetical protein